MSDTRLPTSAELRDDMRAELASLRERLAAAEAERDIAARDRDTAEKDRDRMADSFMSERQARERAEAALADVARMACPGRGYTMQDIRKRALAAAPAHPGTEGDPRP